MTMNWESLSERCIEEVRVRLSACRSVFGGFNVLVNIIQKLTSEELQQLISEIPIDPSNYDPKKAFRPVIKNQHDFVEMLVACVALGISKEVPVSDRSVFEWLNNRWAEPSKFRIGGQPVHMALAACALVPKIILAGWPIPARFAELMPQVNNIHLVVPHLGKMKVRPLPKCRDLLGHDNPNCAFNFSEKLEVCIGSSTLTCPKPGRFIANCYPRQEWMMQGTSEQLKLSDTQVTHAFLSGFQSLCPDVDPEHQWKGQVSEFIKAIRALREKAGCRNFHYEMGNINSPHLLETLVAELFPEVHSVGCNEAELVQILEAIGQETLASQIQETLVSQIKGKKSIESVYLGASHLVQLCGLRRLHVHTWDFHVSINKVETETHEIERDALLFGAVMGAAKTYTELDIQDVHITRGLEIPFSEDGLKQVNELHQHPGRMGACIAHGSFKTEDALVCVVPGRVKPDLNTTVGLGDTLSSMAFLAATANGSADD